MKTVHEKILEDNRILRKDYIAKTDFVEHGEFDREQLSLWKAAKLVFSVMDESDHELFPAFQFESGQPNNVISVVLKRLPNDMTQWQIALWFAFSNSYLDEKAPCECLNDVDGLLLAATAESNQIFG